MPAPPSEFEEEFEHIIKSDTTSQGKIGDLMNLLRRARKMKAREEAPEASTDEDCPEPDEDDCRDLLSPCCDELIHTVFGTLPIQAECSKCKKQYHLRDLVEALQDA